MNINADFSARAVVHGARIPWVASPMPGVERRMLDRIGAEVARATSIVRYAPGSRFSRHVHGGGEEIFVLEGVFQDEHGDYPAGSYVRNPPQSAHEPRAEQGATILVKLWQFDPADRTTVRLDSNALRAGSPKSDGLQVVPLYRDSRETVRLEIWDPGVSVLVAGHGGLEAFVVEGGFDDGTEDFARHSWLRLPPGMDLRAVAGPQGATVWMKTGHLVDIPRFEGTGDPSLRSG